jgi:hypothetical protein
MDGGGVPQVSWTIQVTRCLAPHSLGDASPRPGLSQNAKIKSGAHKWEQGRAFPSHRGGHLSAGLLNEAAFIKRKSAEDRWRLACRDGGTWVQGWNG